MANIVMISNLRKLIVNNFSICHLIFKHKSCAKDSTRVYPVKVM